MYNIRQAFISAKKLNIQLMLLYLSRYNCVQGQDAMIAQLRVKLHEWTITVDNHPVTDFQWVSRYVGNRQMYLRKTEK